MPCLIHYLDDTDDKPQELSEKDARILIWGKFRDDWMRQLRWRQLEQGERVYVEQRVYREKRSVTGGREAGQGVGSGCVDQGRCSSVN